MGSLFPPVESDHGVAAFGELGDVSNDLILGDIPHGEHARACESLFGEISLQPAATKHRQVVADHVRQHGRVDVLLPLTEGEAGLTVEGEQALGLDEREAGIVEATQ